MNTEKLMYFVASHVIGLLNNGLDYKTPFDVTNVEEIRRILGEDFWDELLPEEQKIVRRYLLLEYIDNDRTTISGYFEVNSLTGSRWYPSEFFNQVFEHLMDYIDAVPYGKDHRVSVILGFKFLLTLDKEERSFVKDFVDDYAVTGQGMHQIVRVGDGLYRRV